MVINVLWTLIDALLGAFVGAGITLASYGQFSLWRMSRRVWKSSSSPHGTTLTTSNDQLVLNDILSENIETPSIAAQIRKLKPGWLKILYQSPMKAGTTQVLRVLVGTEEAKSAMEEILGRGSLDPIKTYTYMSVSVRGGTFEITPHDSNPERIVMGPKPAEWAYDIKATEEGVQELEIKVFARFVRPDISKEERYEIEVARRTLIVEVNYVYSFVKFFTERDKTFWGIILGLCAAVALGILNLDSVKHAIDNFVVRTFHLPPAPPK
ncbi:MAG TPA: hypothetical protein VKB67_09400 [Rhizomicrobium sp.]|nr:hypothetical protein [Rhizomicrobium sp.]